MLYFKDIIRDWVPPAVLRWMRETFAPAVRFRGNYQSWNEASDKCQGYGSDAILSKVLHATLRVREGEAAYERDSVLFVEIEYNWPVAAGLMWAAGLADGRLNVLDYGGSLGSLYFQHRRLVRDLAEVKWNIIEQSHYVCAGKTHIQDNVVRFYETITSCLIENQPNVALLSSVLQYLPDPYGCIEEILNAGVRLVIIDRTPFCEEGADRLTIQSVAASIYPASYPAWVLSENKFLKFVERDFEIVSVFPSPEGTIESRHGNFTFKGIILKSRS